MNGKKKKKQKKKKKIPSLIEKMWSAKTEMQKQFNNELLKQYQRNSSIIKV